MAKVYDPFQDAYEDWYRQQPFGKGAIAYNHIDDFAKVWNDQYPEDPVNADGSKMSAVDRVIFDAQRTRTQNRADIDKFGHEAIPRLASAGQGANDVDAQILAGRAGAVQKGYGDDLATLDTFSKAAGSANTADANALRQQASNTRLASDADQASLARFNTAVSAANSADSNTKASLLRDLGGIDRVNPGGYGADVSSVAAGAKADPNAIATQRTVIERMLGQSTAPGIDSEAADASADPESIEAQKFALGKYKDLSDPSISAPERLMMEIARRREEQDNRNAMGAAMRDLEARGIRSGGAEVGALLGSSQITSQNRMLADMAAQANASNRAENALAAYTGTAGNIRGQSFDEKFNTGQAGDAMAVGNRNYKMNALGNAGDLATTTRSQSFDEQFSTGTSADAIAKFNKEQSLTQQRWADELNVKQNEDERAQALDKAKFGADLTETGYGRGKDSFDASTGVTGTQYDRNKSVTDQMLANSGATYDRAGDVASQAYDVTGTNFDRYDNALDDWSTANNAKYNRFGDVYKANRDATAMKVGQYSTDSNAVQGGTEKKAGQEEERRAEQKIEDDEGLIEKFQNWIGV